MHTNHPASRSASAATITRAATLRRRLRTVAGVSALALLLGLGGVADAAVLPQAPVFTDGDTGGTSSRPEAMAAAGTESTVKLFHRALGGETFGLFFAEDAVLTMGESRERIQGRDAVVATVHGLCHGAFAGWMTVDQIIVGTGMAAVRGEFSGTQIAAFAGLEATGRSVAVPYTAFYEVVGGRIVAMRLDISTVEILRQLSADPADTAPIPGRAGVPF